MNTVYALERMLSRSTSTSIPSRPLRPPHLSGAEKANIFLESCVSLAIFGGLTIPMRLGAEPAPRAGEIRRDVLVLPARPGYLRLQRVITSFSQLWCQPPSQHSRRRLAGFPCPDSPPRSASSPE